MSELGVNAIQFVLSLTQIQRRTSEISNALFIRGRNSSIDANTVNYDVASGVADLLKSTCMAKQTMVLIWNAF